MKKHRSDEYSTVHRWRDRDGNIVEARGNRFGEIEGMQEIGKIYPSAGSLATHKRQRQDIADEVNDGKLGKALRYRSSGAAEAYVDLELRVFWKVDVR